MKYIFSVLLILFTCSTVAHTTLSDKQLKGILPPATPGLLDGKTPIVVNKIAAIQLGKALFWDSNIGDNGMACASCHFHAGADRRHINQLNPGQMHQNSNTRLSFEPLLNAAGGANYTLKAEDFPLYKLENLI